MNERDSQAVVDLPDLEVSADDRIVAENIRLMGPMIVSAMFDTLKVYAVVDKIAEHFLAGRLPIGSGGIGRELHDYYKDRAGRMSESERRDLYARTMGALGGTPDSTANNEFADLWLRFVSTVSAFVREREVDQVLQQPPPRSVSDEQLRQAARDLASALSVRGSGVTHAAVQDLQEQMNFAVRLLSASEITSSYGVRDMWQLIDRVAQTELGGARNSSRYRALARAGAIIAAWLANRVSNATPAESPSDGDLIDAAERWLTETETPAVDDNGRSDTN